MRTRVPASLLAAALALAACGEAGPSAGEGGRVDVTPRALAAVVVDHVAAEPRRTTGGWSDPADPLSVAAQVDYGVDPEGSEEGSSHTVRAMVMATESFDDDQWAGLRCRRGRGRCDESTAPDGRTLVFRWSPGHAEEEGGRYSWTVVGESEVVVVGYDESGLFDTDPQSLDLVVEVEELRAAALDPAMSLRTTGEAATAGRGLDTYEGPERRPEMPDVVPTTPEQLAARAVDYVGLEPGAVRRSRLDDLGADAVGVHLEFPAGEGYDAFALDVLTAVGRAAQIDPLPCRVQRAAAAARDACFAWDEDTAATWEPADGSTPGRVWLFGAQDDDTFNRVETVAVLVSSSAIDRAPIGGGETALRLPETLLGDLASFTGDLSVGPERRVG